MDKIAIISDIHGNIPALKAVLNDIKNRGIKRIFCLGDIIGKGPCSDRALDICKEECEYVIKGNWDDYIASNDGQGSISWYQKQLGPKRLEYLKNLPYVIDFFLSGKLVRLYHANPHNVYERVIPYINADQLDKMFAIPELKSINSLYFPSDIVGYGDLHHTFLLNLSGKILFNTGSVGNPLDITLASYVILEGNYNSKKEGEFSIQFIKIPYNIEQAVNDALEVDLPDKESYIDEIRNANYRGKKSGAMEKNIFRDS